MPRRPPAYPAHRGVFWRQLEFGEGAFGSPLAEWAYVLPGKRRGVSESQLRRAPLEEQAEVAHFWFLSNYTPHNGEGVGGGTRPGGVSMPLFWTPATILMDEFANVIPQNAFDGLIRSADAQASFWWFVPELREYRSPETFSDARSEAENALASLNEAVKGLTNMTAGLGHNHGPAILDAEALAVITDAVRDGFASLRLEQPHAASVKSAQGKLAAAATFVGLGITNSLLSNATKDAIYDTSKSLAFMLFYKLLEAATALAKWAATLMIPPAL